MNAAFISAYLINQKQLEELIMNQLRTNETRKVGDLISSALLSALGPNTTNNFAAPKCRNTFKMKVEGGDPVRSVERLPAAAQAEPRWQAGVPYSSSHQLPSFDSAQDDTFSTTNSLGGVYTERSRSTRDDKFSPSSSAQHDKRSQDDFSHGEKTNVAAA
jgi:hypothetical protein